MIENNEKLNCCGCTACKTICPTNAIKMVPDEKGFLYPIIDQKKCVGCNLCKEVCDFKSFVPTNLYPDAYAIKHKNIEEVESSQSGAAFIVLSDYVVQHNGYVCSCEFINKNTVIHTIHSSKEGIYRFKGSKYVQSEIGDCFKMCLDILNDGKLLLFCGTGCQVHGFISLCEKKRINISNLITCDFVCHGCPSIKVWRTYVNEIEKRKKKTILNAKFRDKNEYGWRSHVESFVFEDSSYASYSGWRDNYYRHNMFRDSCYNCKYTCINRKSDFTIADCWGIEKVAPEMDDGKGTSLIMVRTDKAKTIFNQIKENTINKPVDLELLIQPQMVEPVKKGDGYDIFWQMYLRNKSKCMKKYFFKSKLKVACKRMLNIFKRIFKKMINIFKNINGKVCVIVI